MRLIIISGRSGSGKSTALSALEDSGFYCVDNLPVVLLINFVKHALINKNKYSNLAVSIDARNFELQNNQFKDIVDTICALAVKVDVIYLDANTEVLLQRFSQTRRKAPLTNKNIMLREALMFENKLLEPIYNICSLVVDTSDFNRYQLYDFIKFRLLDNATCGVSFLLESFGFKYGASQHATMVFDVRFLPNPYWQDNLRSLSGLDPLVMQYFANCVEVSNVIDDISYYLQKWLPKFTNNYHNYVTVAIGCTGGFHRSVYCAQNVYANLIKHIPNLQLIHRDLAKNSQLEK